MENEKDGEMRRKDENRIKGVRKVARKGVEREITVAFAISDFSESAKIDSDLVRHLGGTCGGHTMLEAFLFGSRLTPHGSGMLAFRCRTNEKEGSRDRVMLMTRSLFGRSIGGKEKGIITKRYSAFASACILQAGYRGEIVCWGS